MPHSYRRNEEIFARKTPCFSTFWAELCFPLHFHPENTFYAPVTPHLQAKSAPKFRTGYHKLSEELFSNRQPLKNMKTYIRCQHQNICLIHISTSGVKNLLSLLQEGRPASLGLLLVLHTVHQTTMPGLLVRVS